MATNKKRRFKKIHVLLSLGVVVVVAVVAVFIAQTFGAGATADAQYMTEAVRRGDIEKTISSSGTLAAGQAREVSASVSGTVSTVHVKVGDTVNKGELLFSVAGDDLDSAASSASSQLSVASQQLKAARASLTSAQATQVQTEKEILAELVKSGSSGASASSGSGSGSAGTGAGTGAGSGTGTSTGSASSTAGSAKSTPTAAQKKAAKAQAIQSAANKVRAVASAQAEVQSATQSVTSAQKAYNDTLSELGKAKVTAPIDGVVTAVSVAKGDVVTGNSSSSSAANTGASAAATSAATSAATAAAAGAGTGSTGTASATSAIEIVNYNKHMTLSVDVSESEINSLKTGMKTVLTFNAFDGLEQEGKISEISPLGTTSGGLVTYPVTIDLSKPDPQLKPGMNADAVVILESVTDVLMVPNTAISGRADKGYTVQVAVGGDTTNLETRTVTLGMANDSYTEVSSGLSEGELVISGSVDASSASSSAGALMGGAPEMRSFGGDPNGGGPGAAAAGSGSSSAGTRGASSTQERP